MPTPVVANTSGQQVRRALSMLGLGSGLSWIAVQNAVIHPSQWPVWVPQVVAAVSTLIHTYQTFKDARNIQPVQPALNPPVAQVNSAALKEADAFNAKVQATVASPMPDLPVCENQTEGE